MARRSRTRAWITVAVSAALFAAGSIEMARRVQAFNEQQDFLRVHAEPHDARQIDLAGFPAVRLTDHLDENGAAYLRLEYAGQERLVPVKKPPAQNLPTLGIYDEWARLLTLNEVVLDERGVSVPKPGTGRLMLVVRRTPAGFDPETWGSVRRIDWVFDFYDLRPDGTIAVYSRRWPRSPRAEERLQGEAAEGDPQARALAAIPPLSERTVEYTAALHVIPKLQVPKHKFTDTAFSPRVLGWTLPATMLAGLTGVVAFFFAVAPRRRHEASPPRP